MRIHMFGNEKRNVTKQQTTLFEDIPFLSTSVDLAEWLQVADSLDGDAVGGDGTCLYGCAYSNSSRQNNATKLIAVMTAFSKTN